MSDFPDPLLSFECLFLSFALLPLLPTSLSFLLPPSPSSVVVVREKRAFSSEVSMLCAVQRVEGEERGKVGDECLGVEERRFLCFLVTCGDYRKTKVKTVYHTSLFKTHTHIQTSSAQYIIHDDIHSVYSVIEHYMYIRAQLLSPSTSDRKVPYAAERIVTVRLVAYVSHS